MWSPPTAPNRHSATFNRHLQPPSTPIRPPSTALNRHAVTFNRPQPSSTAMRAPSTALNHHAVTFNRPQPPCGHLQPPSTTMRSPSTALDRHAVNFYRPQPSSTAMRAPSTALNDPAVTFNRPQPPCGHLQPPSTAMRSTSTVLNRHAATFNRLQRPCSHLQPLTTATVQPRAGSLGRQPPSIGVQLPGLVHVIGPRGALQSQAPPVLLVLQSDIFVWSSGTSFAIGLAPPPPPPPALPPPPNGQASKCQGGCSTDTSRATHQIPHGAHGALYLSLRGCSRHKGRGRRACSGLSVPRSLAQRHMPERGGGGRGCRQCRGCRTGTVAGVADEIRGGGGQWVVALRRVQATA